MALQTYSVPPFDFGNWTGPTRAVANYARTGTVVPDTAYGEVARALYIGGAGTLSLVRPDGVTQAFAAVPVGIILPIYSIMVNSAGTSATNLVWLS